MKIQLLMKLMKLKKKVFFFWNGNIRKSESLWNFIFNFLNSHYKNLHSFSLASFFWVVKKAENVPPIPEESTGLYNQLVTFVNIWPVTQWVFSLITLILMYWVIGTWYNKKLARQGGWISWQTRILMIALDLLINLALGIYYMGARDTLMGAFMLRCPIAISPLIFLIEFLAFIWYYKRYVLTKKDIDKK